MNPFEYASPQTEVEALALVNEYAADTALLAGGTDLISLLKRDVIAPKRVVDLKGVASFSGIERDGEGVSIGALSTLEQMLESPLLKTSHSLLHVIEATRAIQVQANGTLGGDLCLLPHCWYYRSGYGLLAMENGQSLPEIGDNRYHAILGNRGPAKFVSASRFAPAMVAGGAKVRIIGPKAGRSEMVPLEYFYTTPKTAKQSVTILKPGQLISHIWIPDNRNTLSATYEVLQMEGLDWPLAAAAASLSVEAGLVTDARIVLGHVAPVPWVAKLAANSLYGKPVNEETAEYAAEIALAEATPLSMNGYKIQIAKTAVKRVLLRATGQPEGGL